MSLFEIREGKPMPQSGRQPTHARCPICEQQFERLHSTALPFCSQRCKQIDLGRWLDESYGLPVEVEEEAPPELMP